MCYRWKHTRAVEDFPFESCWIDGLLNRLPRPAPCQVVLRRRDTVTCSNSIRKFPSELLPPGLSSETAHASVEKVLGRQELKGMQLSACPGSNAVERTR